MKVNAILLKPLDGFAPGSPRSFDKPDFDRLHDMGAVREAGDDDEVEAPGDEAAQMLERLRHPVEGPRLLGELKNQFEQHGRDMASLRDELTGAVDRATAADTARDAAVAERDDARASAEQAIAARDALQAELDQARATPPAPTPAGKPTKSRVEG